MPPTTEQLVFILIFMYVVTFLGARMAVRRHPKIEGMVIGVCAIGTVFAAAGAVFGVIGIVLYGITMAGFAFKKPADES